MRKEYNDRWTAPLRQGDEEVGSGGWVAYDDLGRYIDIHDYVWTGDDE